MGDNEIIIQVGNLKTLTIVSTETTFNTFVLLYNFHYASEASTAYLYIIVYNREINSLPIKQNIISSN